MINVTQTAIAALFLSFALATPAADAGTIQLRIEGIRSADGRIEIDVYAPPRKRVVERIVAARRGTLEVELDVPAGAYAIMLYHDANANGTLDRGGLLRMPTEGYAFSNDAPVRFGPPSFEAMRIDVAQGARTVTTVRMRYQGGN
jgi:uncharacterized protein (DUF2141 family)